MSHPQQLGAYPIEAGIGQGSMGVVYPGFDPQIQRPVAIKTIRRELLDASDQGATAAARFKVEAQAAGRLNHPGIVSIYHLGEDDECAFIVMEYVEGHSLRDYVSRSTKFGEVHIVTLMAQLLDALDFAHERGVFHRDIKPANLIITRDGRLKVTDFGIARIESTVLTRVNSVIGSPGYMAPEQYTGDVIDRRVDVFASGVLLYQLLTGSLPFTGNDEAVMFKIIYGEHLPLAQVDSAQAFRHFDPIIEKALAKQAKDRYPTARDFKQAMLEAASAQASDRLEADILLPYTPTAPAAGRAPVPGTGGRMTGETPSRTSTPLPPTGWDERMLATLERDLAHFVGPMARVLVRRAARNATDIGQLRKIVAQNIPSAADQRVFLGKAEQPQAATRTLLGLRRGDSGTQPDRTGAATRQTLAQAVDGQPITAASLEHSARVLTRHVGPIAKLMVKKAATDAQTRQQMFDRIAAQLPEKDREGVLDELRRFRG